MPLLYKKEVQDIVDHMSETDKKSLGLIREDNGKIYANGDDKWIIRRILLRLDGMPIGFFDVLGNGSTANISMGIRSDYHRKGYGTTLCKAGMDWVNTNLQTYDHIEWNTLETNAASQKLAKKFGFVEWPDMDYSNENGKYISFIKRMRKEDA